MYDESTTREKILKKVRKALIQKSSDTPANIDFDSDLFPKADEPLEIVFARQLTKLNGKFIYCENEKELCETISGLIKENNWDHVFSFEEPVKLILQKSGIPFSDKPSDISVANVGVTLCEAGAARTGSVLMSSRQFAGRRLPAFSNYHIVILYTSQLVYNIRQALIEIRKRYGADYPSMIINVTGPSRTADIEKTLVQGAHGPKEIYVLLTEG